MRKAQEAINENNQAQIVLEVAALAGLLDHEIKGNPSHVKLARNMISKLQKARR